MRKELSCKLYINKYTGISTVVLHKKKSPKIKQKIIIKVLFVFRRKKKWSACRSQGNAKFAYHEPYISRLYLYITLRNYNLL